MNDKYTRDDEKRFTLRMNSELFDQLQESAKLAKRSVAKQIEFIVEQYLRENHK